MKKLSVCMMEKCQNKCYASFMQEELRELTPKTFLRIEIDV